MGHSGPIDAPICLVGRDYGFEEQRAGRPFVGPAGKLLTRALAKAGIEREQCLITNVVNARPAGNRWEAHSEQAIEKGLGELSNLLGRGGTRRTLIIALGAEAFQACYGLDPRTRPEVEFDGNGITELRGYVFEGPFGPVLASTHPAFILRTWLPWWPCLCWDLAKAKRLLCSKHNDFRADFVTPEIIARDVKEAHSAGEALMTGAMLAVDIETRGPHAEEIVCVAFACCAEQGVVIPFTEDTRDEIAFLLRLPIPKVFHNGQFDVTILERHGLKVNNWTDDTMLLHHCLEPLIAGKSKDGGQATQKSLRFLASVLTDEPFWKIYSFRDETDQLRLCARDARLTWQIYDKLKARLAQTSNGSMDPTEQGVLGVGGFTH